MKGRHVERMKFGEAKYGPGDLNQESSACFFAIMC